MQNLEEILSDAQREFAACASIADLEQAKAKYLGKSGALTELLKGLGKLSAEERPAAGAAINVVKQGVEQAQRVYDLTVLRFEQGLATQLEVSDAEFACQRLRVCLERIGGRVVEGDCATPAPWLHPAELAQRWCPTPPKSGPLRPPDPAGP